MYQKNIKPETTTRTGSIIAPLKLTKAGAKAAKEALAPSKMAAQQRARKKKEVRVHRQTRKARF